MEASKWVVMRRSLVMERAKEVVREDLAAMVRGEQRVMVMKDLEERMDLGANMEEAKEENMEVANMEENMEVATINFFFAKKRYRSKMFLCV